MFRDMQNGADVEVEAILGDLLKRGQSHQLKTPLLQAGKRPPAHLSELPFQFLRLPSPAKRQLLNRGGR